MRHFAALAVLMLLSAATPARATLVTGYAIGQVTANLSFDGPNSPAPPLPFTVGESVYFVFRFDPDLAQTISPGRYDLRGATFRVLTGGGYSGTGTGGPTPREAAVTDGATDRFTVLMGSGNGYLSLFLTDPSGQALSSTDLPTAAEWIAFPGGTLEFGRDRGQGFEGFRASIVPVADTSGFPMPEPNGIAMGLMGAVMAGVGLCRLGNVRRV